MEPWVLTEVKVTQDLQVTQVILVCQVFWGKREYRGRQARLVPVEIPVTRVQPVV